MKRTILSIGLVAIAATAAAQSSVNISGVLKVSAARANGGTTFIEEGIENGWSMNDLSSALIFSGREDLGGGMYAGFELASFMKMDSGNVWPQVNGGDILAGRNFTEIAFALSVLDLPFEAPKHEVTFDGGRIDVDD